MKPRHTVWEEKLYVIIKYHHSSENFNIDNVTKLNVSL